jgi:hypothetical protein
VLGDRHSATEDPQEAATAYRAALEKYTFHRASLKWAKSQNELGDVLEHWANARKGPRSSARQDELTTWLSTAFPFLLLAWTITPKSAWLTVPGQLRC